MSIWASIGGDPIPALENDGDAANYRGEGEPHVEVDVATTRGFHELIRLALWDLGCDVDLDVLVTSGAARELADRLVRAAELVERL